MPGRRYLNNETKRGGNDGDEEEEASGSQASGMEKTDLEAQCEKGVQHTDGDWITQSLQATGGIWISVWAQWKPTDAS